MYSIVDSVIIAFSLLLRSFNPKRNVSTIVTSLWFNKECLMLPIFSKSVFFSYLNNLISGERSGFFLSITGLFSSRRTFISFFVGKAKRSYRTITKEGCPNSGTRKLYHKASKAGF